MAALTTAPDRNEPTMCDDHLDAPWGDPSPPRPAPTRRHVLGALAAVPFGVLWPGQAYAVSSPAATTGGVVRAGLHVHSSFSEGSSAATSLASTSTFASMESQLDALARLGANLCFFTDHDHILAMQGTGLVPRDFTTREDLTEPRWAYLPDQQGGPVGGGVQMTTAGLDATVVSGPLTRSSQLMAVDCSATGRDFRASMGDLDLAITFTARSTSGWAEMRLRGSWRPASSGRPEGAYDLHYRFSAEATSRTVLKNGLTAVITIPVVSGATQTVVVTPTVDLAEAFPDLGALARDNGLLGIWLGAGARAGSSASALFHAVELRRTLTGDQRIALQGDLVAELRARYPQMGIGHGMELSYSSHLNWYSPDSASLRMLVPEPGVVKEAYLAAAVAAITARGGVASVNHPFGSNAPALLSGPQYTAKLAKTAAGLLTTGMYGASILEVGYATRGGMSVAGHLELWDILLTAGIRLMANGVSDNHAGTLSSWADRPNRYFTDIITDTADPAAAVALLGAGRCFVSLRPGYDGMLDLTTSAAQMGGQHRSSTAKVSITVAADALPSNGRLRVVQFPIHGDRTRTAKTPPVWQRTFAPADVTAGVRSVWVANVPSYVRTEVRDANGTVVAFSNPLFIYPAAP